MGTQKLLLPVGGEPTIARIVDVLLTCCLDRVIVVVGPHSEDVAAALAGRNIELVVNPDPECEMIASVRSGLAAVPRECRGVLVALGDQPRLESDVVERLISVHREGAGEEPPPEIIVPTFHGRRGHPMLISAAYRDEIAARFDDVGLRGLLTAHPDAVREVAVGTATVLEDMDDPADYARVIAREEEH